MGSIMFYVYALNTEHAKYALNAYCLEWTEHAHKHMFCVHTHWKS